MSVQATTILHEVILPLVDHLDRIHMILPGEVGKKAVGSFNPTSPEEKVFQPAEGVKFRYEGHPTMELAIGVSGMGELILDGKRYHLEKGDLAIIPPQTLHLERVVNHSQPYHIVWIRSGIDRLTVHSSHYSGSRNHQIVRHARMAPAGAIHRIFQRAVDEFQNQPLAWESVMRAVLTDGLVRLLRHLDELGPARTAEQNRRQTVDLAKAYIQSNFSKPLTLKQIAHSVFLSPNYFSSIFSENVGATVFQYVQRVRLEEAKRMLAETDLSIEKISQRVGIDNRTYFCKVFKQHSGTLPLAFRREARARKME